MRLLKKIAPYKQQTILAVTTLKAQKRLVFLLLLVALSANLLAQESKQEYKAEKIKIGKFNSVSNPRIFVDSKGNALAMMRGYPNVQEQSIPGSSTRFVISTKNPISNLTYRFYNAAKAKWGKLLQFRLQGVSVKEYDYIPFNDGSGILVIEAEQDKKIKIIAIRKNKNSLTWAKPKVIKQFDKKGVNIELKVGSRQGRFMLMWSFDKMPKQYHLHEFSLAQGWKSAVTVSFKQKVESIVRGRFIGNRGDFLLVWAAVVDPKASRSRALEYSIYAKTRRSSKWSNKKRLGGVVSNLHPKYLIRANQKGDALIVWHDESWGGALYAARYKQGRFFKSKLVHDDSDSAGHINAVLYDSGDATLVWREDYGKYIGRRSYAFTLNFNAKNNKWDPVPVRIDKEFVADLLPNSRGRTNGYVIATWIKAVFVSGHPMSVRAAIKGPGQSKWSQVIAVSDPNSRGWIPKADINELGHGFVIWSTDIRNGTEIWASRVTPIKSSDQLLKIPKHK